MLCLLRDGKESQKKVYMAPVPHRGKRNESAFVVQVLTTLAAAYGVSEEEMARRTNENVARVFGI